MLEALITSNQKIMSKVFLFSALITTAGLTIALSPHYFKSWNISDDYSIRFSGRGAEGTFRGLTGTVDFDPQDLDNSRMDVRIDVKTIDTGNSTKNRHAKGDSWFDAEKYPQIRFRSKRFSRANAAYIVTGDLTLHGTTREVRIPFTFSEHANGGLFEGKFTIEREEYGIEGPLLSFTVDDEFEIELRVPVSR